MLCSTALRALYRGRTLLANRCRSKGGSKPTTHNTWCFMLASTQPPSSVKRPPGADHSCRHPLTYPINQVTIWYIVRYGGVGRCLQTSPTPSFSENFITCPSGRAMTRLRQPTQQHRRHSSFAFDMAQSSVRFRCKLSTRPHMQYRFRRGLLRSMGFGQTSPHRLEGWRWISAQ